jgi:hypothetical protein
MGIMLVFSFIFKSKSRFWEVKERPNPPASLTSAEHGAHKFAQVNVSEMQLAKPALL